jgi:predicted nucleic acid-binding protein
MIALDTNVLIYACDRSSPERQKRATELIDRATDGVLLWQVACEFVAASRKLASQGFTPLDAWNRLAEFQGLFPLVQPGPGILHSRSRFTFIPRCVLLGLADSRSVCGSRRRNPVLRRRSRLGDRVTQGCQPFPLISNG